MNGKKILLSVVALVLAGSMVGCTSPGANSDRDDPGDDTGRDKPAAIVDLISTQEIEGLLGESVKATNHSPQNGYVASSFRSSNYQIEITFYQELLLNDGDPLEGQAWTTHLQEMMEELQTEQDALALNKSIRRLGVDGLGNSAWVTFIDSDKEIQLDVFCDAYRLNLTVGYSASLTNQTTATAGALQEIGGLMASRLCS